MGIKKFLKDINNLRKDFVDTVSDEFNSKKNETVISANDEIFPNITKCANCGTVLKVNAKFCDQCGMKIVERLDGKDIPMTKKVEIEVEEAESYGEVMGIEKWKYFGKHDGSRLNNYSGSTIWTFQQAYYNDQFYYIDRGYVWKSNTDGTSQTIIMKLDGEYHFAVIFVNSKGIYIKREKIVELFDFSGVKVDAVETSDIIKSYYICDNRIYMILKNEVSNKEKVIYHDVNTQSNHIIFEGYYDNLGKNSRGEKSFRSAKIQHIMANRKRAVMWLEFAEYCYPKNNDEIYESEISGWYSYDLQKKKMIPLNWLYVHPHDLSVKGAAAFEKKLNSMGKASWKLEETKDYFRIAFFNMEKDLMWTIKSVDRNTELWEPRKIGSIEKSMVLNSPLWTVPIEPILGEYGMYFDGVHRIQKIDDCNLYSYDCKGNKSENWINHPSRDQGIIRICGDYMFVINDEIAYNCDHQYKLQFHPGNALRVNWMHYAGKGKDKTEIEKDKIIEAFERKNSRVDDRDVSLEVSSEGGTSKYEYWKSFVEYASGEGGTDEFAGAGFNMPKPAERNWYALRLGTSKARIELTINTRDNLIRTVLFIKDEMLWDNMTRLFLSRGFNEKKIYINTESKSSSISVYKRINGLNINKKEQYDWFIKCAITLKQIYDVINK